jgi:hypothetical protein
MILSKPATHTWQSRLGSCSCARKCSIQSYQVHHLHLEVRLEGNPFYPQVVVTGAKVSEFRRGKSQRSHTDRCTGTLLPQLSLASRQLQPGPGGPHWNATDEVEHAPVYYRGT